MSRRVSTFALAALLALLVSGLAWIFRARLAHDAYPPYSSLRADPIGTRALHDSLVALPGLRVTRWFKEPERLPAMPPRTIFMLGTDFADWQHTDPNTFNALDAAVRAGSRLVVVFAADFAAETWRKQHPREAKVTPAEKKPTEKKPSAKPDKGTDSSRPDEADQRAAFVDWEKLWGVKLETFHPLMNGKQRTVRDNGAPASFPAELRAESDVCFAPAQGVPWQVLYTRDFRPTMVERSLGAGTIVFAADSYFASNEAMQKARAPALLAWLVGPHANVVFAEGHLGVVEDAGIAALARRYGLAGASAVLVLLAGLFIWRQLMLFVPPAPQGEELALAYQPTAGLEALLRRALPSGKLLPACVAEWRRTARVSDIARVEPATTAGQPADAYNAAVRALRRR